MVDCAAEVSTGDRGIPWRRHPYWVGAQGATCDGYEGRTSFALEWLEDLACLVGLEAVCGVDAGEGVADEVDAGVEAVLDGPVQGVVDVAEELVEVAERVDIDHRADGDGDEQTCGVGAVLSGAGAGAGQASGGSGCSRDLGEVLLASAELGGLFGCDVSGAEGSEVGEFALGVEQVSKVGH